MTPDLQDQLLTLLNKSDQELHTIMAGLDADEVIARSLCRDALLLDPDERKRLVRHLSKRP